jgi:hypothetical protein
MTDAGGTGLGDLPGHLPALRHVLQDGGEPELLRDPQGGEDVVVSMGVKVHRAPALEHLDERLHAEVTRRPFVRLIPGGRRLLPVGLRLDEEVSRHRGRAGAGAGERASLRSERIRAVGHLEAAGDAPVVERDEQAVDGRPAAQLQVERLPAHEVTRAGHHVHGRDAPRERTSHARAARIERVEQASVGMERRRPVSSRSTADMTVRVDEARHDGLAGRVDPRGAGGNLHRGTDRGDAPPVDDEGADGNLGPADRNDARVHEGVRLILGGGSRAPEPEARSGCGTDDGSTGHVSHEALLRWQHPACQAPPLKICHTAPGARGVAKCRGSRHRCDRRGPCARICNSGDSPVADRHVGLPQTPTETPSLRGFRAGSDMAPPLVIVALRGAPQPPCIVCRSCQSSGRIWRSS